MIGVGLIVENGSFAPQNFAVDVGDAFSQVFGLIAFTIGAAIILGFLVAIWYLITSG